MARGGRRGGKGGGRGRESFLFPSLEVAEQTPKARPGVDEGQGGCGGGWEGGRAGDTAGLVGYWVGGEAGEQEVPVPGEGGGREGGRPVPGQREGAVGGAYHRGLRSRPRGGGPGPGGYNDEAVGMGGAQAQQDKGRGGGGGKGGSSPRVVLLRISTADAGGPGAPGADPPPVVAGGPPGACPCLGAEAGRQRTWHLRLARPCGEGRTRGLALGVGGGRMGRRRCRATFFRWRGRDQREGLVDSERPWFLLPSHDDLMQMPLDRWR